MIHQVPAIRRCVVVGAGVLGLSAARALERRGWSVVVLEAGGDIGHAGAGSKGTARIFRLGYPEPHYVEMALMARDLWRALEHESGRRLLHVTGQVTIGDEATLDTIGGAMGTYGAACERLTAAEARARYPGIAIAGAALVEPDSGVLAADACVHALGPSGACELRTGARVTALRETAGDVRVVTASGDELRADVVVACAGPCTMELLGPDAPKTPIVAPSLPQVAYFQYTTDHAHTVPVFIEWGDDMIYGLPVPGSGAPGTIKVSHHTPGAPIEGYDPTGSAAFPDDPALMAGLVDAVRRLLPEVDPNPVATERCVYDNSADTDFVLDRLGNVVVGCGTSGHGFKFGPLLGELLGDLAEGIRPRADLGPFRLSRR